ncbi:MAG TPA: hypothetical protein ENH95_06765 [Nitrosopumilus sp.]|nr:hypothetical protein [Nitrosopumilus sp.]
MSWVHLTELRSFVDFSDVDDPPSNSSFSNFVDYLVSSGFVESRSFRGKTLYRLTIFGLLQFSHFSGGNDGLLLPGVFFAR